MLKPFIITENLYYVGANDRTKHLFENLWPIPKGVSYNSYLLVDNKTVLFDTVDVCYADVFLQKIEAILNKKPIDYIVINHMEPDHSGSIQLLKNKYPNVKIIGNSKTAGMLDGYYNIKDDVEIVKDGDTLNIGSRTLSFHLTPMVHWPETMMTYDSTSKTLFSGDAFGTFGALDGGILDTQLCVDRYWNEMIRYYSNIVGKYGVPVQTALKKLAGVELNFICSTHGPVWSSSENIAKVVSLYDKLSKYETDNGLVIAYGSMYGHVEQLADLIAQEAAKQGVKNIYMHNLSVSHVSYAIRDVFKYKGLLIGSPTYNNEIYPPVDNFIKAIESRQFKGEKYFGFFSGYTWANTAIKLISQFAEKSGFTIVGEPIEMKQALNNEIVDKATALAKQIAEKLT